MNWMGLNEFLALLCLVFLGLIPLIGIPYRFYQMASGMLRQRMEGSSGIKQTLGAIGITLIWINVPVWLYTVSVLYMMLATNGEGTSGIALFMILGACGIGYAIMELFLLPLMRPINEQAGRAGS